MSFFSKIWGKKPSGTPFNAGKQARDPARYEEEKIMARSKSAKERLAVAENPKTHQEILYYLADDESETVRRAIASNPSTPVHISRSLAEDSDIDVKLALIQRLTSLLPDLSQDQYAHLYAYAAQALGILALDEVLKVRLALSSALKDELYAPPEVAAQLAKDLERQVSEPILRLCSAVPDEVLIEILQNHPDGWVVEAIAVRQDLNADVTTAVIETNQTKAGQLLIQNQSAHLSETALDDILRRAPEKPEWHKPLALQSHLPARVVREIILFVDSSIQKLIFERTDMDAEIRNELMDTVSRRVNFLIDEDGNTITPHHKVQIMAQKNELNDDAIKDALALREYDFVFRALSYLSGLSLPVIKKMLTMGSAKSVTSAVWKAGLSMRTAMEVQKTIGKIQPREILYPKNGEKYPMTDNEMQWQVDFFKD
tara:strand:+ start:285 stop:1568 length:1284 start_codon:yes stop_codon:yes gene_type:complete